MLVFIAEELSPGELYFMQRNLKELILRYESFMVHRHLRSCCPFPYLIWVLWLMS